MLIIPAISAALDRTKLGKFLLPITQYMRLDTTQLAHFANGEVALGRNWRKLTVHEQQQVTRKTL
jgi:hypothetical protein